MIVLHNQPRAAVHVGLGDALCAGQTNLTVTGLGDPQDFSSLARWNWPMTEWLDRGL